MIDDQTRQRLDKLTFPIGMKELTHLTAKTNAQIGKTINALHLKCQKRHNSLLISRSDVEAVIEHLASKADKAKAGKPQEIQEDRTTKTTKEETMTTIQLTFFSIANIAEKNKVPADQVLDFFKEKGITPAVMANEEKGIQCQLYAPKDCEDFEEFLIAETKRKAEEEAAAKRAEEEAKKKTSPLADVPPEILAAANADPKTATSLTIQLIYLQLQEQKKTNELLSQLLKEWKQEGKE